MASVKGMKQKGRPRVPTAVKLQRGTFQPCRATPDEPKYQKEIGAPPCDLSDAQKVVWERMVSLMTESGVLTIADRNCLHRYCVHFVSWLQASAALETTELDPSDEDSVKLWSKLQKIEHSIDKQCNHAEAMFGLTPADRSRVRSAVANGSDGNSPIDLLRDKFFASQN